jgi:hypothetical protein
MKVYVVFEVGYEEDYVVSIYGNRELAEESAAVTRVKDGKFSYSCNRRLQEYDVIGEPT